MALENINGQMAGYLLEIGLIITCMGKEFTHGKMEENTKENIKKTRKTDLEFIHGNPINKIDLLFRPDGRKYEGNWKEGK